MKSGTRVKCLKNIRSFKKGTIYTVTSRKSVFGTIFILTEGRDEYAIQLNDEWIGHDNFIIYPKWKKVSVEYGPQ